jgi:hypothetical protein
LSEKDYPLEISSENLNDLLPKAKNITKKADVSLFITTFLYTGGAALFLMLFILASRYLGSIQLTQDTLMTYESILLMGLIVFLEVYFLALFDWIEYYVNKALKFNYREAAFAYCILISHKMLNGKRKAACKEVNGFIVTMLGVKRTTGKEFCREVNLLSQGRRQIKKAITLSEENLSGLLLRFGTSLYTEDNPMAYLYLKQFIHKIEEFEKIEGSLQRIDNQIRNLKGIIAVIGTIVTILVGLWTILH